MNYKTILLIRSKNCRYCPPGYYALGYIADYAREKGYRVIDLPAIKAKREYVVSAINQFKPKLIFGFGHGMPYAFTGDNANEMIFWSIWDLSYLEGSIIYLLSCHTAADLGKRMVNKGAAGFAGYLNEWHYLGTTWGDPMKTTLGKTFFESGTELAKGLIDGLSLKDAVDRAINKYNSWIEYWEESGNPFASEVIKWLTWDRDLLTYYGDDNARDKYPEEIDNRQECVNSSFFWHNNRCSLNPFAEDSHSLEVIPQ